MPWSLLYREVSETEMSQDLSRKAERTEGKAEVTTRPMRSTTDEKVNSRVYWLSAFLSNKASNASGVRVRSRRLLDMTAKGVLCTKRSKTCPRSMTLLPFLFSYLASLCTVIVKHVHLGRAAFAT